MKFGLAVLVLAVTVSHAAAEHRRYALLIGSATGADAGQERLRYAEADAERLAAVLRELGGFPAEDVVVLRSAPAPEVRRAISSLNDRIRKAGGDSLLLVFYSGHAGASDLHMVGTSLPTSELRAMMYDSPATARVLVVDACRSGTVTRAKGGQPAPAFSINFEDRLRSSGVAILTSSAEHEDSQESDALQASFFTYYLASGLRGAADGDGDNRVSLVEAFSYASERTLSATADTRLGPQHPTYSYDLTGRDDLVLTRPATGAGRVGTLQFSEAGSYFVRQADPPGAAVAEVVVTGKAVRRIALPAGRYVVTRRASEYLQQATFQVGVANSTPVRGQQMEQIAYARVVRKGGTNLQHSFSVFAGASARGGADGTDAGAGFDGGIRLDTRAVAAELRLRSLWFRGESADNAKLLQSSRELAVLAVAIRTMDFHKLALGAGAALGWARVDRTFGTSPERSLAATENQAVIGAVAQAHYEVHGRFYLRAEIGGLGYVSSREATPLQATLVWSSALGLGAAF